MKLIDTHCHLYLSEMKNDLPEMILRANRAGVKQFYLPAIDSSEHEAMLQTEEQFPGALRSMMGLHPCSVKDNYREELLLVRSWLEKRSFAAIGEIGLDYYWDTSFKEQQLEAFGQQIELAVTHKLPIAIHSRNSLDDCISMVEKHKGKLNGVFHCFSGSKEQAEKIIDLGFYLGIGGVLTYKNSGLSEVVQDLPLESMVLETDSPYLAPVPFRGKRNESSYIIHIAQKLAEIKNVSLEEVAATTTSNAGHLFRSNQD